MHTTLMLSLYPVRIPLQIQAIKMEYIKRIVRSVSDDFEKEIDKTKLHTGI